MHVLSLDTTTREGSVALVEDDAVVDERAGDQTRSQAERLPAELLALAESRGLAARDVDVFAVASGPGSFTGLRIGIATIQGLALTTGRKVVAVSALDALAQASSAEKPEGALVAAWMDARRRTVFAALYRVADQTPFSPGRLEVVDGPLVESPETTLARWAPLIGRARALFVGDGAALYADIIREHLADRVEDVRDAPLLAGAIGRMAAAVASRGDAMHPAAVQPLYVRRPDVEVERERRRAGS